MQLRLIIINQIPMTRGKAGAAVRPHQIQELPALSLQAFQAYFHLKLATSKRWPLCFLIHQRRAQRPPNWLMAMPSSTPSVPSHCRAVGRSPSSSRADSRPTTGTISDSGATVLAG